MQSLARATKRGNLGFKHKIGTGNKKGRARRTQTIIKSIFAKDANERLMYTINHSVI